MLSLNKFMAQTWEQAKSALKEDLESIEAALNARDLARFGNSNNLKVSSLPAQAVTTVTPSTSPASPLYNAGAYLALKIYAGGL